MASRDYCRSVLIAAAAAALAQIGWSSAAQAQTETQNFTTNPSDWVFAAGPGVTRDYGFRASDNTGGTSPAGEAGGTFVRDGDRTQYGDVTLGGSLLGGFTASGEFFVGDTTNMNNELLIGHHRNDFAGLPGDTPGAGSRDAAGIYLAENDATSFRWGLRMYADDPTNPTNRITSEFATAPSATARGFTYTYVPPVGETAGSLTGSVLDAVGQPINGPLTVPIPAGTVFSADSFGFVMGHHGGFNDVDNVQVFIDGVTYSRAATGDFDGVGGVTPEDFDLLGVEIRKPGAEADDRMFDTNNGNTGDGTITLADRDAVLTAINRDLGDTDLDGDVDLADLGNLATGFQQAGATWRRGDTDLDNDVDLNDLGNLASNFGAGRAAAYAEFQALVPEPTIFSLLLIGASGMLRRRRA